MIKQERAIKYIEEFEGVVFKWTPSCAGQMYTMDGEWADWPPITNPRRFTMAEKELVKRLGVAAQTEEGHIQWFVDGE